MCFKKKDIQDCNVFVRGICANALSLGKDELRNRQSDCFLTVHFNGVIPAPVYDCLPHQRL